MEEVDLQTQAQPSTLGTGGGTDHDDSSIRARPLYRWEGILSDDLSSHERHHRETEVHRAHELRRLLEVVVPHGRRDELATIRALCMPAPSGRRSQSVSIRAQQQDPPAGHV